MILELIGYEVVTTGLGLLGLKAISLSGVNRQLQGIAQPKRLPIIDAQLKAKIGEMSKYEKFISRKATLMLNKATRYHAFRYLIVMLVRKSNEQKVARRADNSLRSGTAGWSNHTGNNLPGEKAA